MSVEQKCRFWHSLSGVQQHVKHVTGSVGQHSPTAAPKWSVSVRSPSRARVRRRHTAALQLAYNLNGVKGALARSITVRTMECDRGQVNQILHRNQTRTPKKNRARASSTVHTSTKARVWHCSRLDLIASVSCTAEISSAHFAHCQSVAQCATVDNTL